MDPMGFELNVFHHISGIAIAKRIAKSLPGGLGHASPLAPLRSALGAAAQSAGTWAVAGESGDFSWVEVTGGAGSLQLPSRNLT